MNERCDRCKFWDKLTDDRYETTIVDPEDTLKEEDEDKFPGIPVGHCRKNAPVPFPQMIHIDTDLLPGNIHANIQGCWPENHCAFWPLTMDRDWCGQFEQKT